MEQLERSRRLIGSHLIGLVVKVAPRELNPGGNALATESGGESGELVDAGVAFPAADVMPALEPAGDGGRVVADVGVEEGGVGRLVEELLEERGKERRCGGGCLVGTTCEN